MPGILRILTVTALCASAALLSACGGDDDNGPDNEPTAAPTGAQSSPSPHEAEAVEALSVYLREVGIDDQKGELTDPPSCASADTAEGDYCIQENFSTFAVGLAIVRVADAEHPEDEVWEVRLEPGDSGWEVTEVTPFGEGA